MLKRILRGSTPWLVILFLIADIISRFVKPLPDKFDVVSVLEAILGIVIASLAVVGAVVVVGTWNDIDVRAKSITDKYRLEVDKKMEEVNRSLEAYKSIRDDVNKRLGSLGEAERTMINLGMLNDGMGSSVKNALEIAWEKMQGYLRLLEEFQSQVDKSCGDIDMQVKSVIDMYQLEVHQKVEEVNKVIKDYKVLEDGINKKLEDLGKGNV